MREIKFRVWDEEGRDMEYWGLQDRNYYSCSGEERYYIMQYTGLKDKNGKEIYEGDIVKYFDSYQVWLLAPIVYAMGCFAIKHPSWDDDILLRDFINEDMMGIEIIGNIYENPDLNE